jgi:hypothetical protein
MPKFVLVISLSLTKEQSLWREEQTVKGNRFVLVYTKSNDVVIEVFGNAPANFRAKIRNHKDLAEVLLTVFTIDLGDGYPADPQFVTIVPAK